MNRLRVLIIFVIFVLVISGGYYYVTYFRGVGPALRKPPEDITKLLDPINNTEFPLTIPAGFEISIFAANLPGARDMAFDGFGNMIVSQTGQGKITLLY